ncbi:hypothetical protein NB709_001136 [Xanthomonas sacchari]|nr:hypothetical protein [Xanthomonas sacchari]
MRRNERAIKVWPQRRRHAWTNDRRLRRPSGSRRSERARTAAVRVVAHRRFQDRAQGTRRALSALFAIRHLVSLRPASPQAAVGVLATRCTIADVRGAAREARLRDAFDNDRREASCGSRLSCNRDARSGGCFPMAQCVGTEVPPTATRRARKPLWKSLQQRQAFQTKPVVAESAPTGACCEPTGCTVGGTSVPTTEGIGRLSASLVAAARQSTPTGQTASGGSVAKADGRKLPSFHGYAGKTRDAESTGRQGALTRCKCARNALAGSANARRSGCCGSPDPDGRSIHARGDHCARYDGLCCRLPSCRCRRSCRVNARRR